jgi:predicted TIM-barrel fold metal-dependent hydrolase
MSAAENPQDILAQYHIIDGDAHWSEPPDLWVSRAPASLKERVPHVKRIDGRDHWFIEGDQDFGNVGLCIVDRQGTKHLGLELGENEDPGNPALGKFKDPTRLTFDDVPEAAYDAKARVKLLDSLGLYAQVVYPNSAGLSTLKFLNHVKDADLRLACIKIYNDAIAEWQAESGDRLLPQAILPIWDREEMDREARRVIGDLKLSGFTISDKPETMGLPNFTSDYWAGFWELCSSTGTPVNFHIGGDAEVSPIMHMPWDNFGPEAWMAITAPLFAIGNARTIICFIYSGLLDKYPGLKLVSVESGIGWIPFFIEATEYQLDEMMPHEGAHLQKRPRQYFHDNFFATFWFEREGLKSLDVIGPRNVLLETDYPHPTCLYPHAEHIASVVKDLSPENRKRVLQDNAAELYRVKLPGKA